MKLNLNNAERNMKDWAKELPLAVTITDKEGTVIYMNNRANETLAHGNADKIIGTSIFGCHGERSTSIIKDLIANEKTNTYTISKKGQKKIVHQTPYYENGEFAGLVEFSIVIPEDLPHYDRG